MPVRLSVSIRDAELVKKRLEDLTGEVRKVSAGRLFGRLESARVKLTRYPPLNTRKMEWVSEKQRRYVMWAIRQGIIQVPYQRTRTYGDAWKVKKTEKGYRLVGRAVSKKTGKEYTKYVSGSAYGTAQARIHQGRWLLLREAVEEAVKELPKEIAGDVVMVARRRGFSEPRAG